MFWSMPGNVHFLELVLITNALQNMLWSLVCSNTLSFPRAPIFTHASGVLPRHLAHHSDSQKYGHEDTGTHGIANVQVPARRTIDERWRRTLCNRRNCTGSPR